MSASSEQAVTGDDAATVRTPLDLKLFYGFVVVLVAGMIALLVLWQPDGERSSQLATPELVRQLDTFAFTDQTGQIVTHEVVANKFAVVNFIHTSCSISCLQVNHQMAEVQRLTDGQDDVRLLSFTVDPLTDTPSVLAEFGKKFGTDATRWSMLTGDKNDLYELIEGSFLKREPLARDNLMPGGFIDADRIAVVDRAGRVRKFFDGMRSETPAAIVRFIDELRAESK